MKLVIPPARGQLHHLVRSLCGFTDRARNTSKAD